MQVINSSSAVVSDVDGQSLLISSPLPAADNYTIKIFNQGVATVNGNFGCTVGEAHNFNGDGKSDIVWRQTGGTAAIWLINGVQVKQSGGLGTVPINWTIAGTGDFNGDGKGDIVWRDGTSGTVAIWLLNGLQVAQAGSLGTVPASWSIVGIGDFNGDGKADLLWRDSSTGTVAIWLLNGLSVLQSGTLGAVPGNWAIVTTGDFNGDGGVTFSGAPWTARSQSGC